MTCLYIGCLERRQQGCRLCYFGSEECIWSTKKKQLLHELSHDFPHWIKSFTRTLLVDQWLRFHAHSSGDTGSIPGQGTKIPHAIWCGKKKKIFHPTDLLKHIFSEPLLSTDYLLWDMYLIILSAPNLFSLLSVTTISFYSGEIVLVHACSLSGIF